MGHTFGREDKICASLIGLMFPMSATDITVLQFLGASTLLGDVDGEPETDEPTAEEMEGKEIIINEIPGSQPQHGAPAKSRTLDAIRGQSTESVTLEHEQMAEPAQADHANAYADHCAAIEGACDTTEWQQAYTTAWTWANETGDQNIIAGIKQIAGERKKQLSAGNGAQQ